MAKAKETPKENHVDKYLELREEAKKRVNTKKLGLRQAWNAAEVTTIGEDGLVNLESLSEQGARDAFKGAFAGCMDAQVLLYYHSTYGDNIFVRNDLWGAFAGFRKTDLDKMVEEAQGKINFDRYMATIKEPFKGAIQSDLATPMGALTAEDGQNVVDYLKKDLINRPAMKLIDVKSLTSVSDMSELLEEYLAQDRGVITPEFVENQPYAIT